MCYIFNDAEKKGIEQGFKQGVEQGFKQGIEQGVEQGFKQGVEQGIKQGVEQGIKQGIEQGIEQGTFLTLMSLAQKGEISHTAAAEQMNISKEEFESKIRDFSNNN